MKRLRSHNTLEIKSLKVGIKLRFIHLMIINTRLDIIMQEQQMMSELQLMRHWQQERIGRICHGKIVQQFF